MCKLYPLDPSVRYLDSYKIHFSIDRTPENMGKAFDVIMAILKEHEVRLFKIAPLQMLDRDVGNPAGKEFTIYIQRAYDQLPESKPEFWLGKAGQPGVLRKIEDALRKEGVKPGKPSKGDIRLQGSNYIYSRQPQNDLGQYLPVELLERLQFTAKEAAKLIEDDFLNWRLAYEQLPEQKAARSETKQTSSKPQPKNWSGKLVDVPDKKLVEHFRDSYRRDLMTQWRGGHYALYLLIFGEDVHKHLNAHHFGFVGIFNFKEYTREQLSYNTITPVPKDFLREALDEASRITALFYQALKAENASLAPIEEKASPSTDAKQQSKMTVLQMCNILPIIYHYWWRPFYSAHHEKSASFEEIKKTFEANPFPDLESKNRFIREVVKRSFARPPTSDQDAYITRMEVDYQYGLTEEDLDTMLDSVKSFNLTSSSSAPVDAKTVGSGVLPLPVVPHPAKPAADLDEETHYSLYRGGPTITPKAIESYLSKPGDDVRVHFEKPTSSIIIESNNPIPTIEKELGVNVEVKKNHINIITYTIRNFNQARQSESSIS